MTWWYSRAAKMNWVYLNAASEILSQVALGDFDGDGRCDVFAVHGGKWVVSSGGTGEWRSLGTHGSVQPARVREVQPGRQTNVFRCYPDERWSVVSPGSHDWRPLASSSFPLDQLHFGDSGRFTESPGADLLFLDDSRLGLFYDNTTDALAVHNLYPY